MNYIKLLTIVSVFAVFVACSSGGAETETADQNANASNEVKQADSTEMVNLAIGDAAPGFTLAGTPEMAEISLAETIEEKPVLLAFFPKAFTGG